MGTCISNQAGGGRSDARHAAVAQLTVRDRDSTRLELLNSAPKILSSFALGDIVVIQIDKLPLRSRLQTCSQIQRGSKDTVPWLCQSTAEGEGEHLFVTGWMDEWHLAWLHGLQI